MLFAHENLRRIVLPNLQQADYENLPSGAIFQAMIELDGEGREVDFGSLSQKIESDRIASELLPMLFIGIEVESEDANTDDPSTAAKKCLDALRLVNINRRLREIGLEMASAERLGDYEEVVKLSSENTELNRLRKSFEPQSQIAQAEGR
jgi:hypothetical protein